MTTFDSGADTAVYRIDISNLIDAFETPEDLVAALSHSDGQWNLKSGIGAKTAPLTNMNDNALGEDDFIF